MPEHDRVGSGFMAIRGYVPAEPATQCEGTRARDCNYLISAVVTNYGPTAQGELLSLPSTDSIKTARLQAGARACPNSGLNVSIDSCQLSSNDTATVTGELITSVKSL